VAGSAPLAGMSGAPGELGLVDGSGRHAGVAVERKWWTLVAVCAGTFMLLLDITVVNVALPSIQHSLSASFSDLQWTVDAYALTLAALLLTTGSLADIYGRRLAFVAGLTVFSVSSLLCGLATDSLLLILARALQGVGGAAMFATSLALLATAFHGKERGVAFAVWGAVTGIAVAVGPILGGAITSGISWRWIFLVNVPIGAVTVAITLFRVGESRQQGARRPDLPGFVMFSGALGLLVYGLIEASLKGWTDALILGCFAGTVVLLAAFLVVERASSHPMFDLTLFRKPTFTGGAIAAFSLSGGLFALLLYIVLYVQDALGYSALQTGLRLMILSGGILLTSTIAGRLSSLMPVRYLIGPGLAIVGVGLLLMRGLGAGSHWTHLIPGLLVSGVGAGLVNPPLASTAVGVVHYRQAGMASGINSTFRQVGIATGIAALGSLFESKVVSAVTAGLHGVAGLAPRAGALASMIKEGNTSAAIASVPPDQRAAAARVALGAFTGGLNEILLVGAVLSFVGAVCSLVLIRPRDFVHAPAEQTSPTEARATV
jgi:EmrB/QacA subfamily drug resistance transporter